MQNPILVVSNCNGDIFEIPGLYMVGDSLHSPVVPDARSLIALPGESVLFTLPRRYPRGYDPVRKQFVTVKEFDGAPVYAAAAFMPPGYIRTLHSAYEELPKAPRLPLYCYAAVGWRRGGFVAAGMRIDRQRRHELSDVDLSEVRLKAPGVLKRWPHNRLVAHLVDNCALTYKCPNACNFVLGRWECPIPVSSVCNAGCLGCISKQPKSSGFPSSQHRINFVPTPAEIAEYVVPHLKSASHPIASFGQGCEGEPLLQADLIEAAIREIRLHTRRGIININTNASKPDAVERLCRCGLGSMRVSLNSARPDFYTRYYRPGQYSFDDVRESMVIARRHKVWVSINYLVFPGFTDTPSEMRALSRFIRSTRLNMIQTRNLNIDPQWFKKSLDLMKTQERPVGMVSWVDSMKKDNPDVVLGYFNPTGRTIRVKART
jgi:pyruvate-formate lyase-activating enzyme